MPKAENTNPSPIVEETFDERVSYRNNNGIDVLGEFGINKSISLVDMCACINNVVDAVIDDSGYTPYFYDVALYGNILSHYTDFDKSVSAKDIERLLCESTLKSVLSNTICKHQYDTIVCSVNEMVELKKQQMVNKSEIDELFGDLRALLSKFSGSLDTDSMSKAMSNLASLTSVDEGNVINALVDNLKGGKSKAKTTTGSKKGKKDNVTILPPVGQQKFDGSEILE